MLDKVEYEKLFKTFYRPLVHFAIQFINDYDVAEDIVQDIFMQLWNKDLYFNDFLAQKTYLYRSTRNKCLNYIRDCKIEANHHKYIAEQIEDTQYQYQTTLHKIIEEEVFRQLQNSISHLPPQCKKICQLLLDGKKPSEIALEMQLDIETIKKQRKIAIKRIREEFGDNQALLFIFFTQKREKQSI